MSARLNVCLHDDINHITNTLAAPAFPIGTLSADNVRRCKTVFAEDCTFFSAAERIIFKGQTHVWKAARLNARFFFLRETGLVAFKHVCDGGRTGFQRGKTLAETPRSPYMHLILAAPQHAKGMRTGWCDDALGICCGNLSSLATVSSATSLNQNGLQYESPDTRSKKSGIHISLESAGAGLVIPWPPTRRNGGAHVTTIAGGAKPLSAGGRRAGMATLL